MGEKKTEGPLGQEGKALKLCLSSVQYLKTVGHFMESVFTKNFHKGLKVCMN